MQKFFEKLPKKVKMTLSTRKKKNFFVQSIKHKICTTKTKTKGNSAKGKRKLPTGLNR